MTDLATLEAAKPSCFACGRKCAWNHPLARWECLEHGLVWSSQMAGQVQQDERWKPA